MKKADRSSSSPSPSDVRSGRASSPQEESRKSSLPPRGDAAPRKGQGALLEELKSMILTASADGVLGYEELQLLSQWAQAKGLSQPQLFIRHGDPLRLWWQKGNHPSSAG
jgi:hypothetical protein